MSEPVFIDLLPDTTVTLEGTVYEKTGIQPNENNKGQYFSFFLEDIMGSTIKCTAYDETANRLITRISKGEKIRITNMKIENDECDGKITLQAFCHNNSKVISAITVHREDTADNSKANSIPLIVVTTDNLSQPNVSSDSSRQSDSSQFTSTRASTKRFLEVAKGNSNEFENEEPQKDKRVKLEGVMASPVTFKNCVPNSIVTLEGLVSGKTGMTPTAHPDGQYFNFFLEDKNGDTMRCTACDETANRLDKQVIDETKITISDMRIRNREFDGETTLQASCGANSEVISAIEGRRKYTPIAAVTPGPMLYNVRGFVQNILTDDRKLKDGSKKDIIVLTLQDSSGQIKVTFWEHQDMVRDINPQVEEEVISIKRCKATECNGEILLNVNSSSVVKKLDELSPIQ